MNMTVSDLREYWELLHAGKTSNVIYQWHMPEWVDICSEMDWEIYPLTGGYFSKRNHDHCGVYRLVGLSGNGDLSRPAILDRVGGKDITGTLYIGEAGRLNMRLNQLRLGKHQASNLPTILESVFPPEQLAIALMFTHTFTKWIERDLINAYINSFGEAPPLNYKSHRS